MAFDTWLAEARSRGIHVVERFATSLDQDRAAVHASLELPWDRLKLLKQSMYGRAKLDLLRRRFTPRSLIHQTRR